MLKKRRNLLDYIPTINPSSTRRSRKSIKISYYAKMILTIPAISTVVEKIFSVDGSMFIPLRRRLLNKLFKIQIAYFKSIKSID